MLPSRHPQSNSSSRILTSVGRTDARIRILSAARCVRRGLHETLDWLPQMMIGTVHVQYRTCGRPTCRCRRGQRHPAHYLFWRQDGKLKKRYLRADEVETVRAACERRRERERERRAAARAAQESWRTLVGYVRGVEHRD
jgi:hypothetical protein